MLLMDHMTGEVAGVMAVFLHIKPVGQYQIERRFTHRGEVRRQVWHYYNNVIFAARELSTGHHSGDTLSMGSYA